MCVCVLRAFRDSRGEGAGGNRAEKPLPSAPNALEAKRVRGRVRITAQVCQRNYFHHHGCSRGRMTTVLKPPAVFARLQKRRPVCLLAPACACPHADRRCAQASVLRTSRSGVGQTHLPVPCPARQTGPYLKDNGRVFPPGPTPFRSRLGTHQEF